MAKAKKQTRTRPQIRAEPPPGKKMWPILNSYMFAKVMPEYSELCQQGEFSHIVYEKRNRVVIFGRLPMNIIY